MTDTIDDQYRLFLYHGLAFLNLYINEKRSTRYLKLADSLSGLEGYKELSQMRKLIIDSRGKLKLKNKIK